MLYYNKSCVIESGETGRNRTERKNKRGKSHQEITQKEEQAKQKNKKTDVRKADLQAKKSSEQVERKQDAR